MQERIPTAIEVCAGAGGQALGLELAGFHHVALVDNDKHCCATLRLNRPSWNVIEQDLREFDGRPYRGVDLLAGGLPCPPFSVAGKQLGKNDERNLFPAAIRLIHEIHPRAVMIENVRGILDPRFDEYRRSLDQALRKMGYLSHWKLIHASDFGVSQLRPRVLWVAVLQEVADLFEWPNPSERQPQSVGELLYDLMAAGGWKGVDAWKEKANTIAPTIVGGSKKHGGPDLGPTRAKKAWAELGVNGKLIAYEAPNLDFEGMPYLTVPMVARLQGFPDTWKFSGKKTASYRQVGNAFPPPVARAVGTSIRQCLVSRQRKLFLKAS